MRSLSFIMMMLFCSIPLIAQEIDIAPALQQVESGNLKQAEAILAELKSKNANDPSVLFLDAVLTKNGDEAVNKYTDIIDKFPKCQYADASLYRIFSYYYSLGFYKKAEEYLTRLKKDFPESPYIKTAERNIPDADDSSTQKPETNQPVVKSVPVKAEHRIELKTFDFTIQAGAFLNVDNAKNLCERLKKENYSTEINTKEVGGSILNVVSVGKFVNEQDAKPVLSYLEKKFNLKGRIVPIIK